MADTTNETIPEATAHEEHYDPEGSKLGMWLFLYTELILFGGLFILYAMYLDMFRSDFLTGSSELNLIMGAINTVVLLTSSLTMAMSILALRKGTTKKSLQFLAVTVALASVFFVIKYFEWSYKFEHHLYPNSEELLARGNGMHLFYSLYFVMTGLHGLHVLIGAALIIWMAVRIKQGKVTAERYIGLENTGLYWHLVDLIWIFLFPLFYLIS